MFLGNFKPIPKFDRYLGELLIECFRFWNLIVTFGSEYHSILLTFVFAPVGLLGISFQFALAHDLFVILTSHIHTIYSIFAIVYKIALKILLTLFYMFRGKKYNILKNKIDDVDFRIEELLFGVLLMTVILFLMPTLMIYYVSMIYLVCFIVGLQFWLVLMIKIVLKLPIFMFIWMI